MNDERATSWVPADTFGTRLLLTRRELGLTTEEAAGRCNIPVPTWNTWENGVTPRKLNVVVQKIHKGLGVDRDYLMWGSTTARHSDIPGEQRLALVYSQPEIASPKRHSYDRPMVGIVRDSATLCDA